MKHWRFLGQILLGVSLFPAAAAAAAAEPPVVLVGFFGVTDPRYKTLDVPDLLLPNPEKYIYFQLPAEGHAGLNVGSNERLVKPDLSFFAGRHKNLDEGMRDPFLKPDPAVFPDVVQGAGKYGEEWYRVKERAWRAAGIETKPVYLYRHGKRWNPEFRIALLQSAGQGRFRVFLVVNAEECKAVPENEEIGARYLASDRADLREIPLEVKTLTENIDGCFQVLEGRYDKGGPKIYRVKGLTKKVKEECRLDLETKLEICRAVYKNAKLSDYGPSDYTRLVIKRGESVVYDTLRVDSNISGSFLKVEVFKTGDYFVILTHADYWGDFINVTIMDKRGNLWERGWEWPSGC